MVVVGGDLLVVVVALMVVMLATLAKALLAVEDQDIRGRNRRQ